MHISKGNIAVIVLFMFVIMPTANHHMDAHPMALVVSVLIAVFIVLTGKLISEAIKRVC